MRRRRGGGIRRRRERKAKRPKLLEPGGLACYSGIIAKTYGWALDYILWELPLAVGLQLQHVAVRGNGVETIKSAALEEAATDSEFDELLGLNPPGTTAPDQVTDDEISGLLRETTG